MRILLIHNRYQYYGGEETYVESLKKLLGKNGHKVYLYTKDSKNIKTLGDKIKAGLGLFWNFRTAKELTEIIKEFKPNIAHFNNIYPLIGATAFKICHNSKIPIIQTIHNYRFMCPKGILFRKGKICERCINKRFFSPAILYGCYHQSYIASLFFTLAFFYHKYILKTFNYINLYIFPSKFTQSYYLRHLNISKKKTTFLPYFVDIKPSKKPVKKGSYYLFVGRLSEEKGIIELLEVFKKLPEYKLKVIGTGPLQEKVHRYKRYQNIDIVGYLPHFKIIPIFKKARALIVPSLWYEVFPLVIIEAIMSKINIISFIDFSLNNKYLLLKKIKSFQDIPYVLRGTTELTYKQNILISLFESQSIYPQLLDSYIIQWHKHKKAK